MSPHRIVQDLAWAELSSDPWDRGHLTGVRARGKAFEKSTLKVLARKYLLWANPWFEYKDKNGGGMCSPDGVIMLKDFTIVIECKLTWSYQAHLQLSQLYFPVLELYTQRPCKGIVVCKNLAPKVPKALIKENFHEAVFASEPIVVVQWLGRGPL